jgi:uncharacterized protein YjiS (DUF1127 family)
MLRNGKPLSRAGNSVPLQVVWVLAFALAYIGLAKLARFYGVEVVGLIGLAAGLAAWLAHTDRSRVMAEDVSRALQDAGLTRDQAAREVDESPAHWSEQFAGTRMLSLWRLASLPDAFQVAFAKRVLARYAPGLIVIERGEVVELITTVRQMRRKAEVA